MSLILELWYSITDDRLGHFELIAYYFLVRLTDIHFVTFSLVLESVTIDD